MYQANPSNHFADENGNSTDVTYMDSDLYNAAAKGDIDILEKNLETYDLRLQLTPKKNTLLHIAAQFGQLDCVEWMLHRLPSSSSLLQQPNLKGDTPLHLAAREGHLMVVKALIHAAKALLESGFGAYHKAMLRMRNKQKDTALHEAVRYHHSEIVKTLMEEDPEFIYGANITGYTPLYMAAERGFGDLVDFILAASKSSAHSGIAGRTALYAAVIRRDEAMTRKILEWKSDLTKEVDENGWSPLHCAAFLGYTNIVKQLLEKSSNKSAIYLGIKNSKRTALHIAAQCGHKDIVELLLSHSPDCYEQVDCSGRNVFHFAMMKKKDNYPGELLENDGLRVRGVINEKDVQGNTPLHLLASYGIDDKDFIMDKTVDKMELNNEKLTPIDLISRNMVNMDHALKLLVEEKQVHDVEPFRWQKTIDEDNGSSERRYILDRSKSSDLEDAVVSEMERASEIQIIVESKDEVFKMKTEASKDDKEEDNPGPKKEEEGPDFDQVYIPFTRRVSETHLIVAALIATVTFAAGFTMPGGFKDDDGKAILSKKAAFQAFVVTDTIAMMMSVSAVFVNLFTAMHENFEFIFEHVAIAFLFTTIGVVAMVVAFMTGIYAVLPISSGLPIVTCIICSFFLLPVYYVFRQGVKSSRAVKPYASRTFK